MNFRLETPRGNKVIAECGSVRERFVGELIHLKSNTRDKICRKCRQPILGAWMDNEDKWELHKFRCIPHPPKQKEPTMRTVEEIKAEVAEDTDGELYGPENNFAAYTAKPEGMTNETVAFIVASAEDDMDAEGWAALLHNCNGKTEEEIVQLAYDATKSETAA